MKRSIAAVSAALLASGALTCVATAANAAAPTAPATGPTGAAAILRADPGAVKGTTAESYQVHSSKVDASGAAHTRYTRSYRGLRVYGGDFVIHTTPSGGYAGSSVGLSAPLTLGTTAKVSAASATKAARARFSGKITSTRAPELFVDASSGTGRLAWETVLSGWLPDGQTPSRLHVITDATTGAVVGSFDEIETVAGTGNSLHSGSVSIETTSAGSTYLMIDAARGNGSTCDMNNTTSTCTTVSDADNTWGTGAHGSTGAARQTAAVDAHYGAAKTFDYYKNTHGRNGIFGNGAGVPSRVHYGRNFDNAFWDGSRMTYGDNIGDTRPLISLDVAAHEMSHGVTDNVVPGGLTYDGESGGINEATSDIFGNMVEFYANAAADPGDYQVGEKVDINGDGTPLRYMYNPGLDGASDTCWSTNTKNKNVHFSSGVANHFYFNLAEGTGATPYGTSPVCGSASGMTGIGRAKAEKIWFRALDVYFTSNTSYVNTSNPANTSRAYTLQATTDLYGKCSVEYKAVRAAWTAVNVAGNDPACVTGNDFSLSLNETSGEVFPGSTKTIAVSTALTAGVSHSVTFSTLGMPAGWRATFNPGSVQTGNLTTLSIATAATTPPGVYPVTITGSGAVSHSAVYTLTIKDTGRPCPAIPQVLANPGFESGIPPWTGTSGVVGSFSAQPARSGTRNAWLGGYGSTHTDTLAQSVALPAGCVSYTVGFWLRIDSAETTTDRAYDTLKVQVVSASGAVLGTLATYSNLDETTGYSQRVFELPSSYAGQTVSLKFTSVEDSSLKTSFVLDDTWIATS
ncbi:M4 family metallopeptidase [Micromonospora sp. NPDC051006]|uniref:M4 family metallopeptidase n=1 Tax=Micromonospora sp. NPDC051006 TaxID=3364283 RepID=UPI0037A15234